MIKHESKDQVVWGQYVRELSKKGVYFYYELKQTKKDSFPFANFEDHQLQSLQALENGGLVWKISDSDPRLKPCDGISTPPLSSFIVIKFPRYFCMIRLGDFIKQRDSNPERKSITLQEAKNIAFKIVHI